ncbi:pantothenate kinase [Moraxella cuniculi DSM 21768]|uniref:Type III pantothenate kinase n=1 Tax=Moraxella cuniculi DSM 21768 TaxID=1122245 RepID=A0A1N7E3H8_9GAMM|nr:pantothenate kinase [Moraxella cuniculi]OOS04647.1 pantothenate kinase [Moraxella cuniculi]SIR82525.1 pantothenate kinase [Moraxella cuniculi DSM 21768]
MKQGVLWLDLGNTRLKYWLIEHDKIILSDAKEHLKAPNELLLGLLGSFAQFDPAFIGISSVLGERINETLANTLTEFGRAFEFAKVNDNHPMLKSHYHPKQLGVDRWLQMLGVVDANKQQCVIGCGTALTIDVIDKGVHLGGYILPNVYMQRHALYAGTQQIGVKKGRFDELSLGLSTDDAVNHGVLFGVVSAVKNIQQQYPDYEVILTGGGANMLSAHLDGVQTDAELLLKGLQRYFCGKSKLSSHTENA